MQRDRTVGGLRHRTDIDGLDVVGVRLREDGPHHVLGRGDVDFEGFLREVVRLRGDHAAHMQHHVRAGDTPQHVVVVHQVAPHDADFVRQRGQLLLIGRAFPRQDGDGVSVGACEQLMQPGPAHRAGRPSQKDVSLHSTNSFETAKIHFFGLGSREYSRWLMRIFSLAHENILVNRW